MPFLFLSGHAKKVFLNLLFFRGVLFAVLCEYTTKLVAMLKTSLFSHYLSVCVCVSFCVSLCVRFSQFTRSL